MKKIILLLFLFVLFISNNLTAQSNALNFDGTDDFVEMHSDFSIPTAFSSFLTIEFWVKTSGTEQTIMSKEGVFNIHTTDERKLGLAMEIDGEGSYFIESNNVIADGNWHHIAITKKGSSVYEFTLWVDGIPQSDREITFNDFVQTSNTFFLGKDNSTVDPLDSFEGELDELRIWDISRSCDAIYSNINNEIDPLSESFLIAYYTFNQGTPEGDNSITPAVDNLIDYSANNREGILTNFALSGTTSNWVTGNSIITGITPNSSPKLFLSGNSLYIPEGNTPIEESYTDFGTVNGIAFGYYTIQNLGVNDLTINNITINDGGTGQFILTSPTISTPPIDILASCSNFLSLDIEFTPINGNYGEQTAIVTIESNDGGITNTYSFNIKAIATPQIRISDDVGIISSGSSTVDFGTINRCNTITKTFTIENIRGSALELSGNVEISGDTYFEVTSQPTISVIDGVAQATFTISYTPTEAAQQRATVAIYSNDEDTNPFMFQVQGTGNTGTYPNYDWIEAEQSFSTSTTPFYDLKIAQDGSPYVAFQNASGTTSVRKYNGTNWLDVAGTEISSDIAINQSMVITREGTIYVAYNNSVAEVIVMEFDGTTWTNISDGGAFISSSSSSLQLALDKEEDLFLAYQDNSIKAQVVKYDDQQWENIGGDASDGQANFISLAINNNGNPIIAFRDFNNGLKTSVREYNGDGGWGYIGSPGFSSQTSTMQSISIDKNNYIYVAYNESGATKVAFYEGVWIEIGSSLPTLNSIVGNLLVDLEATPYLTLIENVGSTNDVRVKKYNGSDWTNLAINTGTSTSSPVIDFNTNGVLHIAYQDNIDNTGTLKKYIPNYSEINVQGNSTDIVNGDTSPSTTDDTDFGSISTNLAKTYTIINDGGTPLNITSIAISGTNAGDFAISSTPTSIANSDSEDFIITFTPTNFGTRNATVIINTDNCETPSYTFDIQGTGLKPDIFVKEQDSDTEVVNGSSAMSGGNTDFGSVEECSNNSLDKTFVIRNDGNADLTISSITTDNIQFAVTSSISSIISGSEATFVVTFDPENIGTQTAMIQISTNDPDEEPYTFQVIAEGLDDTEVPTVNNPANQTVSVNTSSCTFDNDIASSPIQNVSATDNCNGTLIYNYFINGQTVNDLTNQVFNLGVTTVNYTVSDGTNINNDPSNTFTVTVIDPVEINVQGNNITISNNDVTPSPSDDTDFGDVGISSTKTVTYTIQNTGTEDLNISSIGFLNTVLGFETDVISPFTISAGSSQTFDVRFTPLTIDSYTNTIVISSNDCEDGTYSFDIQGQGVVGQEINLTGNGTTIADGDITPAPSDHTIFPTTLTCGSASSTRTYTIESIGSTDLTIDNITLNTSTGDFTLSNLPTDFPSNPLVIAPTQSYSFDVVFNPSVTGSQIALVNIENNDIDENPYNFNIQAEGINDTQAPSLVAMQDFTRNTNPTDCFYTNQTTSTTQQIPNGTASDNCRVSAYNYLLSGATLGSVTSLENVEFNTGITTITWTARDENGNTASPNTFTITVVDNKIPSIEAPSSISINADLYTCTADSTGLDIGNPIVSDNCLVRIFNDAPALFPLGETTVIWTAIDSAGNTATDEQVVTIIEQFFVSPSDSLILVDIYNQTGGQNWVTSWDLTTPVSTWNGIEIGCGQIISIDLSNNNLVGTLPTSILGLSQINAPSFSLKIQGNRLSFGSSENFVGQIPNFTYSPQAKIYSPTTEIISEGESITFNSATEGDFTFYQWYKDQTPINGANAETFTITNAIPSDAGVYFCTIKNSVSNQLTLERHSIKLIVEGFLNETDSLALVAIFNETGGNTTWNRKWNLTNPVATWEGVTLSGNKLTELDLSSRNMIGTLPDVFDAELFSELRYLSFFDNDLEGQIPSTIGNLTTLTYLDLDKNNFEGAVPASFGNLINLQALWLSRNNLDELPDEIGSLAKVRNLYLNENNFATIPETIGNLSELLVLNISDNDLNELPNSITNLAKLIQLYANQNFISVLPTGIENLNSLVTFEININNLNSLDIGLLQLNNLKELRVAENELEFDDLLPFANSNFNVFDYAPQAPINEEMDILALPNSSVFFTIQTQGNGNIYQWLKDGNPISTLQNFTLNQVQNTDRGIYTALITNPNLADLTLKRRSVRLNIECQSGLSFEIKQPLQTVFCQEQPFGIKLTINADFTANNQIRWRKDGIVLAFANEKTYTVTQAGTYTAEVLTANGCTALSNKIEITTLPNPEVSILLINEKVLESTINSQETVTYQWLKDGNPIENGFESSYTPTQTGEYSLLVLTESGCSSVSEIIIFTDITTGIEEPKELKELALFPNPNNGSFFIDFGTNTPNGDSKFILIDAIGRIINVKTEQISSTRYKAKTNNLAGGIYYLQIQTKDGIAFRKFVIEE
ncbi:choice-of-anchor D domain-containing protein [Bernardetia sp. Wsw4-3y2]|uniref:choice-of-anchor D domain-containing protein n=1 Tax=Bernardetia sp. Wsw4-3y2 TaxID=3127471 RepID=UPI0030CC51C4